MYHYSYHAYFILSHKSEKCVTERNRRLNLWSLFVKWGIQPVPHSYWLNCWKWLVPNTLWFSNFLSNEKGLDYSSQCKVFPKLSNSNRINFHLLKVRKITINFELFKVSKMTSLKMFIYLQSWEARNIKFGQQVNLYQRVILGTPAQEVLTSLSHIRVAPW